jgi:flagellar biogenesis protein FliO
MQMEVIQPAAAVVLVLALLGGTLLLLRRRGGVTLRTTTRNLQLLERLSLGPQHALHLVRSGGRTLLIATSPHSCQMLETRDPGSREDA